MRHAIEPKGPSLLRWTDEQEIVVVSFGEVPDGWHSGPVKRQYWYRVRQGPHGKIFFEGVIG